MDSQTFNIAFGTEGLSEIAKTLCCNFDALLAFPTEALVLDRANSGAPLKALVSRLDSSNSALISTLERTGFKMTADKGEVTIYIKAPPQPSSDSFETPVAQKIIKNRLC